VNGNINKHNHTLWVDKNPHWIPLIHTQRSEKLNVLSKCLKQYIDWIIFYWKQFDISEIWRYAEESYSWQYKQ